MGKYYTVKSYGVIEGREFSRPQQLKMVTEYRPMKKVPDRYGLIAEVDDITPYIEPYLKPVDRASPYRIFPKDLIRDLTRQSIARVGPHVFLFDQHTGKFNIYRKIKTS